MPVGDAARTVAARGRRNPLPLVTVDKDDWDGPTFIRTWTAGPLNEQVCTGEVQLTDAGAGAVARALVDHITFHWDRPDGKDRDA